MCSLVVTKGKNFIKKMFNNQDKLYIIPLESFNDTSLYKLLCLIKEKLIEMFCNYEFQKDFQFRLTEVLLLQNQLFQIYLFP